MCVGADQVVADGVTSAFTLTLPQTDALATLTRIAVSTASATSAANSIRVVPGIGGLACSLLLAYVCSILLQ